MHGHAVHHGAHAVLADAVVDEPTAGVVGGLHALVVELHPGVAGQVGPAGEQAGHHVGDGVQHLGAGLAGGEGLAAGLPARQLGLPALEAVAAEARVVGGPIAVPGVAPLLPGPTGAGATAAGLAVELEHVVGDVEGLLGRQAEDLLGDADLVLAEGAAVGFGVVGELRRGVADVAAQHDERRAVLDRLGPPEGGGQGGGVVRRLADVVDVPAVGLEPLHRVVAQRELGGPVDGDVVVVVDVDQPAEAEVAGEGGGLVADALLQVAVRADHVGEVVGELGAEAGAEPPLGDPHADAHAEALAERAGRDLDAAGVVHLGVPGGHRAPLAERLQVLEGEPEAGEVQHRVEQHRGVAAGEHEPVAVGPVRVLRVVVHDIGPQHVGQRGEGHRRARVAGVGGLGHVHGQASDDVDGALLEVVVGHAPTLRGAVLGDAGPAAGGTGGRTVRA